jgi:hypothetical protein
MESSASKILAVALLVVLVPAALVPITSYDFFWHLATGRWIVEHHALPLTDPFAVASDRTEWINGEWLFQTALYSVGSLKAAAWTYAIAVAAMFAFAFFAASRKSDWAIALVVTAFAFAGGFDRLDARPSTAAAAILVVALVLLQRELDIAYVILTIVWINVHPSAVLAPLLALIVRRVHWLPLASAAALLVNPFGWKGVVAPLQLTLFVRGGTFVNAEWLPSPVRLFPLLYISVAVGIAAFLISRKELWRFVVFALLAYLAIAHVRNQGLYWAALPLLLTPMVPQKWTHRWLAAAAIVPIAWVFASSPHRVGLDPLNYPVDAVTQLRRANLPGNIYNPDQFGGFLIWAFYPERRALTDGRNELYHTYIAEYARARTDSRAWHALLAKYRIDLAVDEYREPLDVVDARTQQHRSMPASLAYWPRKDWALIGFDRVAMVYARRAAFAPQVIEKLEVAGVVPDAPR